MTSMVTVRNIPEEDKAWLQQEAERNGRSMEAQLRWMITEGRQATMRRKPDEPLADFLARTFGPEGGFELEIPKLRGGLRIPDFMAPEFDEPEPDGPKE